MPDTQPRPVQRNRFVGEWFNRPVLDIPDNRKRKTTQLDAYLVVPTGVGYYLE